MEIEFWDVCWVVEVQEVVVAEGMLVEEHSFVVGRVVAVVEEKGHRVFGCVEW